MTDMSEPKVSIVIATYNVENLIEQTLRSVFDQTFSAFEVIVVDDCSTDATADIVDQWAEREDRLVPVRLPSNSRRPAVPRNIGLARARGEYVAILDHDDLWVRNKLERQVAYLDAHPEVGMVHSYMWRITDRSRMIGLLYLPNPLRRRSGYDVLRRYNPVQCSSVLARTEVLVGLGGFDEDLELRTVEDFDLWIRVSREHRIRYLSEVHGYYRWLPSGAQAQENWLARHQALDALRGTESASKQPSRPWQVARKFAGFPLAVFAHLVDAPWRVARGRLPRAW